MAGMKKMVIQMFVEVSGPLTEPPNVFVPEPLINSAVTEVTFGVLLIVLDTLVVSPPVPLAHGTKFT